MTEEKAQDTLKVGIEELLEKEGCSVSDFQAVVSSMRTDFVSHEVYGDLHATVGKGGILSVTGNCASSIEIKHFIKWLQDNFLPKGKKDDRQEDSKTPFEDA